MWIMKRKKESLCRKTGAHNVWHSQYQKPMELIIRNNSVFVNATASDNSPLDVKSR